MAELREYQSSAVEAVWNHLRAKETNPVVVIPTGGGKSHIIAELCRNAVGWGGRVVQLAHVRELLEQTSEKLSAAGVAHGIYSAGLGERDAHYPVTVAGIQSVYDKPGLFDPAPDLVILDECHRLRPEGEGMYGEFLAGVRKQNPSARFVGLTATAYRLGSGQIARPGNLLQDVCYEVGLRELIRDGYLSPLRSKAGSENPDLSGVHLRGGEFVESELERAVMADERKVALAVMEILDRSQDRRSALVFCVGLDHARMVARLLREGGAAVGEVYGETPGGERAEIVRAYRAGELKFLVNCEVLTLGFDAPATDLVAILRPTMSPGLWYQMVGRGFRLAPGKADCLVLDFGGNALRHGPVDEIRVPRAGREPERKSYRECPRCREVVSATRETCPDCGFAFPKEERGRGIRHGSSAYDGEVISGDEPSAPEEYPVVKVSYWKHYKKDAPEGHPPTLWVQYDTGLATFSEWVCLEHSGFARRKAALWWSARSEEPCPPTVDLALATIARGGIREPARIEVRSEGKYVRVSRAWEFRVRQAAAPESQPAKDVSF